MTEAYLKFDGDLLSSATFKKGIQERPLWIQMERLKPNEMVLWADRFDSLCSIASEWALAQALEEAYGLTLPTRTQYVRTILCEINRLVWLTTYLGRLVKALGQQTLFQYIFVLREHVLTIQEELTGGRILPQAFKVGGCRRELPLGNIQKIKSFLESWSGQFSDWYHLIKDDGLLNARLKGLLPIDSALIKKLAWWGIVGKAGGVAYDVRRLRPHGAYPFVDFKVPSRNDSDGLSRFEVAIEEVELTIKLLEMLLKSLPEDSTAGASPIEPRELRPGYYTGSAESAKGPIISAIEVNEKGSVSAVRLFSVGQRAWPVCDHLFSGLRAEDFEVAFNSVAVDPEDAET